MKDDWPQVGELTFEMTRTRPDGSTFVVQTQNQEKYPDRTGVKVGIVAYLWIPEKAIWYDKYFKFENAVLGTNYATWDFSGNLTSDFHHKDLQEGRITLEASAMDVPTSGPLEAKLTLTIVKRSTGEIFSPQYKVGLVSNQDVLEFRGGNWTHVHRVFPIKLPTTIPDDAEPTQPDPAQPQPAPHEQHHYSPADSSGQINCPSCGHGNRADYSFCESCGTPIPKTQTCPSCGQASSFSARFCDQCGANLPGALGSQPHSQAASTPSAPSSSWPQTSYQPSSTTILESASEPARKKGGCLVWLTFIASIGSILLGIYGLSEDPPVGMVYLSIGAIGFFSARSRRRGGGIWGAVAFWIILTITMAVGIYQASYGPY